MPILGELTPGFFADTSVPTDHLSGAHSKSGEMTAVPLGLEKRAQAAFGDGGIVELAEVILQPPQRSDVGTRLAVWELGREELARIAQFLE